MIINGKFGQTFEPMIIGDKLVLNNSKPIYSGKIFASAFGSYAGYDKFNKQGDTFLIKHKIIEAEPFDQYYGYRGTFAELILTQSLTNAKLPYMTHNIDSHGVRVFDEFNDPNFGGVRDVTAMIKNEPVVIEVKSKNIKDLQYLKTNGYDQNHRCQVEMYTHLAKLNKFIIAYVGFTDAQEKAIEDAYRLNINFNTLFNQFKTNKDLEFDFVKQILLFNEILNQDRLTIDMKTAYSFRDTCVQEGFIPLNTISDTALQKLGLVRPITIEG